MWANKVINHYREIGFGFLVFLKGVGGLACDDRQVKWGARTLFCGYKICLKGDFLGK